jgi:hypothetical protein
MPDPTSISAIFSAPPQAVRVDGRQQAQSPADSMRRLESRGGANTVMFDHSWGRFQL